MRPMTIAPRSDDGSAAGARVPARIRPPAAMLPAWRLLPAVVRNPLEIWPQAVYEQPTFRRRFVSRDTLFVMDPDLIREVLVDRADQFEKSRSMLRALEPALGRGLLTADGPHWRWQRRAASPIFRHERIRDCVPVMIAAAEATRDRWLAGAGSGPIDVAHEMMRTTFDIIVETMLSGHGGIDAGRVERGISDYLESTSWTVMLGLVRAPDWTPYPGRRRAEAARDYLRAEVLRIVAARRAAGDDRGDLISLLLAAEDPESGQAMDDRELADNLLTFITAGHETTALALTWAFYLLDLHPEAADAVAAEAEAVTGGGPLRPEHLDELPFARQVLQEAMRLYPPAPIVVRDASEDLVLGGEAVPRGMSVFVPVYAVHRHAALWSDPDRFDPGRFAPEAAKARHRYAYLPFGAGPRICIGMGFALLEATAILVVLVRALRAEAAGAEPSLKLRVTLRPGAGMPMRVARRA